MTALALCLWLSGAAAAQYAVQGSVVWAGLRSTGGGYAVSAGLAPLLASTGTAAVRLAAPLEGKSVSGTLDVAPLPEGDVAKVELYVDGRLEGVDAQAPFAFALDTRTLTDGDHLLLLKPYDAAGQGGEATTAGIVVSNRPADAPAAPLGEVFAYPNPAARGRAVFHVQSSGAERLRLRVLDLRGRLVHEAQVSGAPSAGARGQVGYELVWRTAGAAAGAYLYVVELESGGRTHRAMGKIAVVH